MLICGDSLIEMGKLEKGTIDLIYLDPPFFTQKEQTLKTRDNKKEYSFGDIWKDIVTYKEYIKERLVLCKSLLKDTGSIFLHCDRSASHYLRIALDEVFGYDNFQSEIIWTYKRWSNSKKGLLNAHQIIFFYSKTKNFKFNPTFTDYSPTTNIDQIFQKRIRDANGKTIYKKFDNGTADLIEEKKGVPLSDVREIPYLNPKAKERVGYPTQKPILLIEKIIKLVTDKGDLVLDPFCGSGTTLVAAKLCDRKYIGIDISADAIKLAQSRLDNPIKTESILLLKGKESYINKSGFDSKFLDELGIISVQRNKGIDGFLKDSSGSFKPIPVRIQKKDETLSEAKKSLLNACKNNGYTKKILISTESDSCKINNTNEGLIVIRGFETFKEKRSEIINS